jgi:hypothetical protein
MMKELRDVLYINSLEDCGGRGLEADDLIEEFDSAICWISSKVVVHFVNLLFKEIEREASSVRLRLRLSIPS